MPDLTTEYRERATQLARRFAVMEGVVGVALFGELALGVADRHSAVHLVVYLHSRTLRTWHFGEAPIPAGESRYHGLRLDVSYLDYDIERGREWSDAERWAGAFAEALYDPEGRVQDLLADRTDTAQGDRERAVLAAATHAQELLDRVVPASLYRGDLISAHAAINHAIERIAHMAWMLHDRPAPGLPWLIARLASLDTVPDRWQDRLSDALTTRDVSTSEAGRRRGIVSGLLRDLWSLRFPNDPLEARSEFVRQARMLSEMARRGVMPLDDFEEKYALSLIVQSPAFDLITVRRDGETPLVDFDYDRLRLTVQHDLGRYLDHQQRLLRELDAIADDVQR